MKKLAFMLFVAVMSIAFVACGDSKDSQTQSSVDSSESTQKSTQDSQDSHDILGESASKDLPKDLQFDADKKLNYRTVPCKEQLDGYSFTAPAVAICESKTLKRI